MSTPADYPRPGAWRDDPEHAQTLLAILERGSPEQLRDLEAEGLLSVGDNGQARLSDGRAYSEGVDFGHAVGREDGEQDGYDRGYHDGHANGEDRGREDGYEAGHKAGYGEGYRHGRDGAAPSYSTALADGKGQQ